MPRLRQLIELIYMVKNHNRAKKDLNRHCPYRGERTKQQRYAYFLVTPEATAGRLVAEVSRYWLLQDAQAAKPHHPLSQASSSP